MHTFRIGFPQISLRINGVDLGLPVQGSAGASATDQLLHIGARFGPTLGLQGSVAEIIFHNRELLPTMIDSVEAVLSAKYGIAIPPTIPFQGLTYWLRADAGVDTTSSGRVTSWSNTAFTSNSATQSNDNYRPRFVANAINGKPSIDFDGNDFLGTTTKLTPGHFTAFCVFKSSFPGTGLVYEHGPNTNISEGFYLTNSTGHTVKALRHGSGSSPSTGDYIANWASDNAYKVVTHQWRFSTPQHILRANGVELPLSSTGFGANVVVSDTFLLT